MFLNDVKWGVNQLVAACFIKGSHLFKHPSALEGNRRARRGGGNGRGLRD